MTDKIDDIVIPILRNLQTDIGELKSDVSVLKEDVSILKESVRRIDSRMSSMDHYMAGFYSEQRWQNDEIDYIKGRLHTLEKDKDSDNDTDPPAK